MARPPDRLQSHPSRSAKAGQAAAGGMAIGALALALASPMVAKWEGKRNDPYRDIVGVWTVCYGETRVPMRRYSDPECGELLRRGLERDYMPGVLACAPALRSRPYELAAATSLAYNIGTAGFCRSTASRLFNAGDWPGGCRAIGRFTMAGGRQVQGLINRRRDEVALCLLGSAS